MRKENYNWNLRHLSLELGFSHRMVRLYVLIERTMLTLHTIKGTDGSQCESRKFA